MQDKCGCNTRFCFPKLKTAEIFVASFFSNFSFEKERFEGRRRWRRGLTKDPGFNCCGCRVGIDYWGVRGKVVGSSFVGILGVVFVRILSVDSTGVVFKYSMQLLASTDKQERTTTQLRHTAEQSLKWLNPTEMKENEKLGKKNTTSQRGSPFYSPIHL